MSDSVLCKGVRVKHPDESGDIYAIGFAERLALGESLSSVSSLTFLPADTSPSPLTITNPAVNPTTITDLDGNTILANTGVQWNLAGGIVGVLYYFTAEVITTTGRKIVATCRLLIDWGIPNTLTTTTTTTAP